MTTTLDTRSTTKQGNRDVPLTVYITITHTCAIDQHGVIQQRRTICVFCIFHLGEEFTKQLGMINIDFTGLALPDRIAAMMCQRVVRIFMTKMGKDHFAVFARNHEGKHTGHVSLESQQHQVVHQLDVFLMRGNTNRTFHFRQRHIGLGFCFLDLELHTTYRFQIFTQLGAIFCSQSFVNSGDVFTDIIKNTTLSGQTTLTCSLIGTTITKQSFEYFAWAMLHRQRGGRTGPGDGICIG